jgi:hypothetical protein
MQRQRFAWQRPMGAILVALAAASWLGCAFGEWRPDDPMRRRYSLELIQHDYTQLVRWSEFERAAAYVDPEVRDDFLRSAPDARSVRFTEAESGAIDLDDEMKSATVEVTYYAYAAASPIEVKVTEKQEWTRADGNNWKVRPTFVGLDALPSSRDSH